MVLRDAQPVGCLAVAIAAAAAAQATAVERLIRAT